MSWLTLHFASGAAFFSGFAALCVGLLLTMLRGRYARVFAWVVALVGVLMVALSATPLPWWAYAAWGAAFLAALLVNTLHVDRRLTVVSSVAAIALSCVIVGAELRHRMRPDVPAARARRVYVIGDSLSAGMGIGTALTWPDLIRSKHGVDVVNISRDGATVASALRTDQYGRLADGLVLLEIGGNDQFGRTPLPEFEATLAELLKRVAGPGRVLVMFDLPLLPLNNGYGRVQRSLASEHGVVLIPKRFLIDVIAPADATTDGVHLTAAGHQRMADAVWSLVGHALPAG